MSTEILDPDRRSGLGEVSNLLQQQVAEILFGDVRFRPPAHAMVSLIEQGLTEDDILAAGHMKGYETPIMDATLRDLDVAIPYVRQLSDRIAQDHGGDTILLASRDLDVVADHFMVRYPDLDAHLLPASQDLMGYDKFEGHETILDTNLASRFLGRYSLTATRVADSSQKFAVFDSGFRGTIGGHLDRHVERIYGISCGVIVALPGLSEYAPDKVDEDEYIDSNVDVPKRNMYEVNAEIINPLAAAVVMHRVVKDALEQRETSHA